MFHLHFVVSDAKIPVNLYCKTYFNEAVLLCIVRFSARDAKLDSKSPVNNPLGEVVVC